MAIKKKSQVKGKLIIDLTGPEGNTFVLMGYARKLAKALRVNPEPILNEMMSGDYENLIKVFDREFGDLVDLIRD